MKDLSQQLILWFKKNKRSLPWRTTRDPYKIWISEIMLQQTTVNTVIPYYERWIRRFPNIKSLSSARASAVLKEWQGLGYYSRARNAHKAAKIMAQRFQGRVPCQKEILRQLPGFGPYTTGAVLSIAFGQREPIVDANVRRVMMRLAAMRGAATAKQDVRIEKLLIPILPKKDMSAFNQGLMELGALICRPQEVLCLQCPLRSYCQAYAQGIQEIIPERTKKVLVRKDVAVAILRDGEKVFIQRRPAKGLLANFWEFPGGKKEGKESLLKALEREIFEEIGVKLLQAKPLPSVKHFYTKFCVHLYPFICTVSADPGIDQTHRWVSLKDISKYPVASGTVKIIDMLKERIS